MDLPRNRFKARLAENGVQYGLWVTIPDPSVVEALAGAGFDWIVLDSEHTPVEPSGMLPLLQAAAPYPADVIVRPVVNDTALIKRHLDQGALSILLPYIQNAEEARAAAAAVRYPPGGLRGVAGTMRAARYGRVPDYIGQADAEICLILQIETAQAVANLDAIVQTDGVDAIFIGPSDLAASLGYPGQPGHPEVRRTILRTIERAAASGKPAGILTLDGAFARECVSAGAKFVGVGLDMALLVGAADALAGQFKG